MQYKKFKNGDENISLLGLGCMRLPKLDPEKEDIDAATAQALVDMAYANGINYFDTAYFYHGGASEAFIGQALKKYPRESFYLATKMPVYMVEKDEDIPRFFAEQLERCQVDYFDFYLAHALDAEKFAKMQKFGLLEKLSRWKAEGKIRHVGFSFHDTPEALCTICDAYDWEFGQLQINALDWDIYKSEEQYNILAQRGIPCIVMEPVRGGRLAQIGDAADTLLKAARPQDSIASWSLRFAATLPNVMTVLSGMSTLDQVEDNLATFQNFEPLGAKESALLHQAVKLHRQSATIGCTACRYCMPCPAGVNIPGEFALYNECALHGGMQDFAEKYEAFPPDEKGTHCVRCGQCENACPQSLPIPDLLEKLETGQKPV